MKHKKYQYKNAIVKTLTKKVGVCTENFQQCKKIIRIDNNKDTRNIETYLSLRRNGCDNRKALIFSSKNRCRYDMTKNVDGPNSHRILVPQIDSAFQYQVIIFG